MLKRSNKITKAIVFLMIVLLAGYAIQYSPLILKPIFTLVNQEK